jgi:hypothetical protein
MTSRDYYQIDLQRSRAYETEEPGCCSERRVERKESMQLPGVWGKLVHRSLASGYGSTGTSLDPRWSSRVEQIWWRSQTTKKSSFMQLNANMLCGTGCPFELSYDI